MQDIEKNIINRLSSLGPDKGNYESVDLETDRRVFARITDGIYRTPSAALRELIFNAYDADATEVYINTDAPSFKAITVRDNGNGMSEETLVSLLRHIGGSMKRTKRGKELGVTSTSSIDRSPRGRKLIGKLGIGLFAVVQLTRHFQIVTKVKGRHYRLVAEVKVANFSDQDIPDDDETVFKTGEVRLWKESADLLSHGTDINLLDVKPNIQKKLRSEELWALLKDAGDQKIEIDRDEPVCHIGEYVTADKRYLREPRLPFRPNDKPGERMAKLFGAALDDFKEGNEYPSSIKIFDDYFKMIWDLAIAVPVAYIDKHPFELTGNDGVKIYSLPAMTQKGRQSKASPVSLKRDETIARKFSLSTREEVGFKVLIDGIELQRPIAFRQLPQRSRPHVKDPMIFIGTMNEKFSGYDIADTGGVLSFESYIYFNTVIVPSDSRGSLIRIHGASGTGFDNTFMNYQISEQNRLRQITVEIFIKEGMDPALNIDRESFNFSHPHYLVLQRWLHFAIGRYVAEHKRLGDELGNQRRGQQGSELEKKLRDYIKNESKDLGISDDLPRVTLVKKKRTEARPEEGSRINDERLEFVSASAMQYVETNIPAKDRDAVIKKAEAIGQLLYSYGFFDGLSQSKKNKLMNAILQILAIK